MTFKLIKHKIQLAALLFGIIMCSAYAQENVVLVIIDGARYSETFGDNTREYIPSMDSLAQHGTIVDSFYNDGITYTSRAIPALWCGTWTEVRDTTYYGRETQYTLSPSIFEYIRHDLMLPANQCYYVLKYINSLWLPSFHEDYGPEYWPEFHSVGSTDEDVRDEALSIMQSHHPRFTLVYLADVDHAGHSGNWDDYITAIETADAIVGDIWEFIQNDPVYADNTVMMVTNDHGRHDDQHGGFSGHGDGCDGCRHIMMLAIGPGIREGIVENSEYRTTPDFAVTACEILDVNPSMSDGDVMQEIFVPNGIEESPVQTTIENYTISNVYPNPFNSTTTITLDLERRQALEIDVYNVLGKRMHSIARGVYNPGQYRFSFNGAELQSGTYFLTYSVNGIQQHSQRIVLVK